MQLVAGMLPRRLMRMSEGRDVNEGSGSKGTLFGMADYEGDGLMGTSFGMADYEGDCLRGEVGPMQVGHTSPGAYVPCSC